MDMRIPPLEIKITLESNSLRFIMLVRRLDAVCRDLLDTGVPTGAPEAWDLARRSSRNLWALKLVRSPTCFVRASWGWVCSGEGRSKVKKCS